MHPLILAHASLGEAGVIASRIPLDAQTPNSAFPRLDRPRALHAAVAVAATREQRANAAMPRTWSEVVPLREDRCLDDVRGQLKRQPRHQPRAKSSHSTRLHRGRACPICRGPITAITPHVTTTAATTLIASAIVRASPERFPCQSPSGRTMQRKPRWHVERVDRLRHARRGAIAAAIVRRAQVRAALHHLARDCASRSCSGRSSLPARRRAGCRACSRRCSIRPWSWYQSVVHSQTLPAMS